MTIRVLISDDHMVVRKGIQILLNTDPNVKVVGEAEDGKSAIQQVENLLPDVVLMDLVMPSTCGIEAIAEIKDRHPQIKIIVLTTFEDDERIEAAMEAGADGYILKDADGEALLRAIQAAHEGEMPIHPRIARHLLKGGAGNGLDEVEELTEREKDVLRLVARGLSNKDIAGQLSLSEGTVKVYVSRILSKLRVSSRTEAAVRATQLGLISASEKLS